MEFVDQIKETLAFLQKGIQIIEKAYEDTDKEEEKLYKDQAIRVLTQAKIKLEKLMAGDDDSVDVRVVLEFVKQKASALILEAKNKVEDNSKSNSIVVDKIMNKEDKVIDALTKEDKQEETKNIELDDVSDKAIACLKNWL